MRCFYSKVSFDHKDNTCADIYLYRKVGGWYKVEITHLTMFDNVLSQKVEKFVTLKDAKNFYLNMIIRELSTM